MGGYPTSILQNHMMDAWAGQADEEEWAGSYNVQERLTTLTAELPNTILST